MPVRRCNEVANAGIWGRQVGRGTRNQGLNTTGDTYLTPSELPPRYSLGSGRERCEESAGRRMRGAAFLSLSHACCIRTRYR